MWVALGLRSARIFLGFDAAHRLWSSHNCQVFRTIDRWSQQKRASYWKVQKCSGFLCTSWRRFFHLYTEFSWQEGLWEFVRRRTSLLMFVYHECNLLFCALSFFPYISLPVCCPVHKNNLLFKRPEFLVQHSLVLCDESSIKD
jgi:hypothetical protein